MSKSKRLLVPPPAPQRTVAVPGLGRVTVVPDVAIVRLGVQLSAPTVREARSAAAGAMNAVLAALRAAGIADADIRTETLSLQPDVDYSGPHPRVVGHAVRNVVAATIRDLGSVSAAVDGAVEAGATTVEGVSFEIADPGPAQRAARAAAIVDALGRADALARAAGVSVGRVVSIAEGSAEPPPVPMMARRMVAAEAATPVEAGTSDVVVSVAVVFELI